MLSFVRYEESIYKSWIASVDETCSTTLNFPLITRNEETNLIAVNFDPKVCKDKLLKNINKLNILTRQCSVFKGIDPTSTWGAGEGVIWWRASANCALAHTWVSGGMWPPQKLENFVFLQLESCNEVNTFRCKFRACDE